MTEQEHIELIRAELAREVRDHVLLEALSTAAIAEHPRSPRLWCLRGDAISLMHDPRTSGPPIEALAWYRRATELDPLFAEPWEEIGYYLDTHEDAFEAAEMAFRKALALGAGLSAWLGVARVLAEHGRRDEAFDALGEAERLDGDLDEIEGLRREIVQGLWEA